MIDRKFIGFKFNSNERTVLRWKISQFANSIRDNNPLYYDLQHALKNGYRDLLVPPTFITTMTFSDNKFFEILGIDYQKLLDGGREIKYYSQIFAGDTIIYQTMVDNITEKEGKRGKMDIVRAITKGINKETQEKVFDIIITLIVFY